MAAAGRAHRAHMGLEAMASSRCLAVVTHRHRQKVVLQVGVHHAGLAADETTGLEMVGGAQAAAQQQPFDADLRHHQRVGGRIQRDRLLAGVLHIGFQVVLQVLAHAAERRPYPNAQPLQQGRVADARELQQLRRIDGAAAQDHLAAGVQALQLAAAHRLYAHGARRVVGPVEQDAGRERGGLQRQVGALQGRAKVRHRGAPAPAPVHRHVHRAKTLLAKPVHVVGACITRLLAGRDEGLVERVAAGTGAHMQRPGVAPVGVTTLGARLGAAKVRQATRVGPFRQAVVPGPAVVIERMAADVDHAVDRRRTPDHLAARAVDAPVIHERLGLGLVHPAVARVGHRVGKTRGHVDEQVVVEATGLEQQHTQLRVFREAVGQHAAGRPRADDDVVVLHAGHAQFPSRRPRGARSPPGAARTTPGRGHWRFTGSCMPPRRVPRRRS